ncbi:MAG: SPOR domain-containing protein [Candidatus Neomarinimicrobiota bacterium]
MYSSQKYFFQLIGFCLLASSCEKPTANYGTVGNYYSVQVKEPVGIELPSYAWDILSFPNESMLTYADLYIRRGGKEMSFQPDEPGNYSFELIIYNKEGLSVVSSRYDFMISNSATASISMESNSDFQRKIKPQNKSSEQKLNKKETPKHISSLESNVKTRKIPPKKDLKTKKKISPRIKKVPRADSIPSSGHRFTIQLFSESSLIKSKQRLDELIRLGFDAYIQKAYFQDKDELWYRVRVGAYDSKEDAKIAASEIKRLASLESWVDKVRVDQ